MAKAELSQRLTAAAAAFINPNAQIDRNRRVEYEIPHIIFPPGTYGCSEINTARSPGGRDGHLMRSGYELQLCGQDDVEGKFHLGIEHFGEFYVRKAANPDISGKFVITGDGSLPVLYTAGILFVDHFPYRLNTYETLVTLYASFGIGDENNRSFTRGKMKAVFPDSK